MPLTALLKRVDFSAITNKEWSWQSEHPAGEAFGR